MATITCMNIASTVKHVCSSKCTHRGYVPSIGSPRKLGLFNLQSDHPCAFLRDAATTTSMMHHIHHG